LVYEKIDTVCIIIDSDFVADGYKIINKKAIEKIKYGKQEKFYEILYKLNNIKTPSKKIETDLTKLLLTCMQQK